MGLEERRRRPRLENAGPGGLSCGGGQEGRRNRSIDAIIPTRRTEGREQRPLESSNSDYVSVVSEGLSSANAAGPAKGSAKFHLPVTNIK